MKLNLVLFLLFFVANLAAQQPFFYKVDSDMGLPSDEVYEVEQDSFGYIWIGCDAGLFRYDGVEFKAYQNSLQSGRSISRILVDDTQRIWCQNFSGQIFYALGDSLFLFKDFSDKCNSFPLFDFDKKNNHLWVATDKTIECFDVNSGQNIYSKKKEHNSKGVSSNAAFKFFDNQIFLSAVIFQHLNTLTQQATTIKFHDFDSSSLRSFHELDGRLVSFFYDKNRENYQFVHINKDSIELINTVSDELFGHTIYKITKLGNYYAFGTSDGLKLVNERFEVIKSFLPNEKISDILQDREGNIWLTSLQSGIYVINSLEFEVFSDDFFPENNITAMTIHQGQLVIGTYSGNLFYFNPSKNTFEVQPRRNIGKYGQVKTFGYYKDKWLVSRHSMVIIDEQQRETSMNISNVRQMTVIEDTLFIATSNSVAKHSMNISLSTTIQNKTGRAITKHPKKNLIYYGSINGFFQYKNGKSTEIFHENKKIYPSDFAWQGDTLWVCTIKNGLFLFVNNKFVQQIKHGKTLPGTILHKIYRHQNQMLLASDIGVVSMDLNTKEIIIFDASDGLRQKQINAMKVLNGILYVGTSRGLVRFPLSMNVQNNIIPNIAITAIKVNNELLSNSNNIDLPYYKNNLTFSFKTALMRSRGQFYYEYRLVGFHENWKKVNATTSSMDYNTLPSGRFQFEVRAINEDGVRSKIKSFSFVISKPIWKRWWFIGLSFLVISGLIYWLVQRRIRNIQHQANIESELKSSQLTAIKAQMNPHFLYNALNSIQDLILQKDVRNASRYLSKFSLLMRQVLETSGNMSVSMMREIEILKLYLDLEKLRFGDEFEYQLNLPSGKNLDDLSIPSMIIQPFVENAIKHGLLHKINEKKQLFIDFQITDVVICTITDNGVGRVHSAKIKERRGLQPVSFATSATQRRLDILNQKHTKKIGFEIIDLYEKEVATGTKVVLTIPIY
jgi:sensor histidine kinase YesM